MLGIDHFTFKVGAMFIAGTTFSFHSKINFLQILTKYYRRKRLVSDRTC